MRAKIVSLLFLLGSFPGLNQTTYAQQTSGETFESLRTEHQTSVQEAPAPDRTYWQDYRDRWHSAVDTCQSSGLNPGQCNSQYLVPLRQEAIDRLKSEGGPQDKRIKKALNEAGREGRAEVREAYLQRLEERQAQAKSDRQDQREDRRDRREDLRDEREDRQDRRENRRDRREDFRDRHEDVHDRFEDTRDRREDIRDRREDRVDALHDGGRQDRIEDRRDRREDRSDRREDRRDLREDRQDHREDIRDTREDVRDRREDVRDRREDRIDRRTTGAPGRHGGPKGVPGNRGVGRR